VIVLDTKIRNVDGGREGKVTVVVLLFVWRDASS